MDNLNRIRLRLGLRLNLDPDVRHPFETSSVVLVRSYSYLGTRADYLAVHRDAHSEDIGLVGGSVNWWETAREAALRESLEEAGLTIPLHALRHIGCWGSGCTKNRPTFGFYCTLPTGSRPIGQPRQIEANHALEWVRSGDLRGKRAPFAGFNRKLIAATNAYRQPLPGAFSDGFDLQLIRAYQAWQIK